MTGVVLVLENGRSFFGKSVGPVHETIGEVVFNTSMTGYQEILTDPSYAGQIVVMTAPQIGNTGVNEEDIEGKSVCAGLVVRESSEIHSNWRAQGDLSSFLTQGSIPGIQEIDTRALTRILRSEGAMRGAISPSVDDVDGVLGRVRESPPMQGRDLASEVSCQTSYSWDLPPWQPPGTTAPEIPEIQNSIVALDFGVKESMLRDLRSVGCRTLVVPARTTAKEILSENPHGVFLSNGPGDPAAVGYATETVRELLASKIPIFGICLGHQILATALGARTFKLPFGHHGGNHPVMDLATRKVEITAQNHGFAVDGDSLPEGVRCTHINLYDNTVEGIEVVGKPVFGVQYHPEASPGPHDALYLFERFADCMRSAR